MAGEITPLQFRADVWKNFGLKVKRGTTNSDLEKGREKQHLQVWSRSRDIKQEHDQVTISW